MKKSLLLGLIATLVGLGAYAQTTIVDSIKSDGIWRSYRLYIPANYNSGTSRPLIMNMHGLGSNAYEQEVYSNFMPIADTAGFLMAYPQGLTALGYTYWGVGIPLTPNTDDVKFISALIDTISSRYTINQSRVYATGMSLGGYMSHYLALKLNNRIAAIASIAGTMYPDVYANASPGRAVPMMQIHGTADSTVPYNGSGVGIPIDTLVNFWVRNNQCSTTPVHSNISDINTSDQCTATHDLYSNGRNGATCEFYKIEGGAHTWPGSPVTIDITNQDFNASVEIWRFFRNFQLTQFVGIASNPQQAVNGFYPNPCHELIHLNEAATGNTTIYDLTGRNIQTTSNLDISLSNIPSGWHIIEYTIGGKRIREKLLKN